MAAMYDPGKKREFFLKRAQRLLPSYFFVIFATLVAAAIVVKPNEYSQVFTQTLYASLFSSNVGFWLENSYFDKSAFKPLLHLWSLGVEIQFYIFLPVFFWIFKKFRLGFFATLLGSATFCFLMVGISPKTSFFWMPLRVWEFLIGYGIFTKCKFSPPSKSGAAVWAGAISLVALICIPLFPMNGEAVGFQNGHPGLISLLVSLATGGVLNFGLPKIIEENKISDILEKIGGYSYSIYLAHFPVIVLFLYTPFGGTRIRANSFSELIFLCALVLASSVLLYRFIEKPTRKIKHLRRWVPAATISIFVVGIGGQWMQNQIIPRDQMLVYEAWTDRSEYRCGKLFRITSPKEISCEITNTKNPTHRILLVGNSHADSIKQVFLSAAQNQNHAVYFMVENTPLMKGGINPEKLILEAKSKNIDSIVLHYLSKSLQPSALHELSNLAKTEKIQLSLILPVPVWSRNVPQMIMEKIEGKRELPIKGIDDYKIENSELLASISSIKNMRSYDVVETFCHPKCQLITSDGKPIYFDAHHLTLTGSKMLEGTIQRLLLDLASPISPIDAPPKP